jgi:hypothetical protein
MATPGISVAAIKPVRVFITTSCARRRADTDTSASFTSPRGALGTSYTSEKGLAWADRAIDDEIPRG